MDFPFGTRSPSRQGQSASGFDRSARVELPFLDNSGKRPTWVLVLVRFEPMNLERRALNHPEFCVESGHSHCPTLKSLESSQLPTKSTRCFSRPVQGSC